MTTPPTPPAAPCRIALDIDGVLANFSQAFILRGQKLGLAGGWPAHWTRWDSWFPDTAAKTFSEVWATVESDPHFWLYEVKKLDSAFVDFPVAAYVTARPIPDELTASWLGRMGFPEAPVVTVSTSKLAVLQSLGIDLFVDDKVETFEELNAAGLRCLLMTQPHNRSHDAFVGDGAGTSHRIFCLSEVHDWTDGRTPHDAAPPLTQVLDAVDDQAEQA